MAQLLALAVLVALFALVYVKGEQARCDRLTDAEARAYYSCDR